MDQTTNDFADDDNYHIIFWLEKYYSFEFWNNSWFLVFEKLKILADLDFTYELVSQIFPAVTVILDHSNWSWYSYAQSYDRRKLGSYWCYRMSERSYEIIDALLILIVDNHWISIKTAIIYVVTK